MPFTYHVPRTTFPVPKKAPMPILSQLLAGGLLGLGTLLMLWSKLRDADVQRARADSLASWIGGRQDADAAQTAATSAARAAGASAGENPLDW